MTRIPAVYAVLLSAMMPHYAVAQSASDRLAQEWRDAKRSELLQQRAAIDGQMATLDASLPTMHPPGADPAKTDGATTGSASGTSSSKPSATDVKPAGATEQQRKSTNDAPSSEFAGLKFGIGISFTLDSGDNDRVSEASLVNGIVRVNDEDNGRARIMLESHYFFTPDIPHTGLKKGDWGVGPFVSLQPGTDNIIEAIGMGLMVGFRRPSGNDSFNLGIGMVIDPNTRILGDGIVADQPLPLGETEVRYKEEMQKGFLILSSFSF
jgi:hypothetical protein